ncbi:cytochrome P450 4d8-like isoform X1 [Musca autumnalis]|uniref:cytochrome P450 4d8-like isoform X1 n=1 Tax=Musca autumnalis TaxID=221902 RepID=UPI003CEC5EB8
MVKMSALLIAIVAISFMFMCHLVIDSRHKVINKRIVGLHALSLLESIQFSYRVNDKNVFELTGKLFRKYAAIIGVWGFRRFVIFSIDTKLNEQLLVSPVHIAKHRNYEILKSWLGTGLLLSDKRKWHHRRKLLTPAFHFKILEDVLDVYDRQSTIALECLAVKADGKTAFDVYPFMCLFALDVIAEAAMGTKVNAQLDKNMPYTSAVREMTAMMAWRFLRIHIQNEITFTLFYPLKKLRQMKLISIMHKFTRNVIEKRRQELENMLESNEESDVGSKKRMALLDLLLRATIDGQPLSDEDIREEVDTFMFEGHDTTTSALSFTLYLLARHPQVQNKLLAEIRNVYPNEQHQKFTLMNLNELKYMECVIKEVLRLYPSVPIIAREIVEDFKYEHSKLGSGVIPAGTEFMVSLYGMMRNPNRFPDPLEFRPERHQELDSNSSFTFVPFSAGPRNCIGQKFAMYEMKVILVKILHRYELLPMGEDIAPIMNIVMRSDTGMQLGMKERKNENCT